MELNRIERRALLAASALVVLGAAVRVGIGPGEATWAWRSDAPAGGALDSTRARVEREIARAERIATPLADGETLDPNVAPDEELQRLPGIGPGKARAIIAARQTASFRSAEELVRVPGLGPATVARLRPYLRFPDGSREDGPLAAPPTGRPSASQVAGRPGGAAFLDLNEAGAAELEALPGLGPVRAAAIVTYRTRHGPFAAVEDLTAVPGIGPTLLKRLRPYLRVR